VRILQTVFSNWEISTENI